MTASKTENVVEHFETAREAADRVSELLDSGFEFIHVIDEAADDPWL